MAFNRGKIHEFTINTLYASQIPCHVEVRSTISESGSRVERHVLVDQDEDLRLNEYG